MKNILIDPTKRLGKTMTWVGFEDIPGKPYPQELVKLIIGYGDQIWSTHGRVVVIDYRTYTVYLEAPWEDFKMEN